MYAQEESHWWYVGMRTILLSLYPPTSKRDSIRSLDAGCGTGFNLAWLEERYGGIAIGLDYIAHALPYCRARRAVDLVRGNVADLPFADGAFGLVTCLDVLTQLETEAMRLRALHEIRRVLEPGGLALIRVAAHRWLLSSHDEEIRTFHRFGAGELREALNDSGFQLLRFTFANSFLFPVAVVWRMLKRIGLGPAGSDVSVNTRGPQWFNVALRTVLSVEGALLRNTHISLPFGLSILAVARRPSQCYTSIRH